MQEFEITSQVLVAGATFFVWASAMREQRRRQSEQRTDASPERIAVPVTTARIPPHALTRRRG